MTDSKVLSWAFLFFMAHIYLSNGSKTIVDQQDYVYLSQFNWHYNSKGYAYRWGAKKKGILMHREIMGTPVGVLTDNINGNRLDNRRINLRFATAAQNSMNSSHITKSGFKGIFRTVTGQWAARLRISGKSLYLGIFKSPREAADAYNKGALLHYGKFAKLNEV